MEQNTIFFTTLIVFWIKHMWNCAGRYTNTPKYTSKWIFMLYFNLLPLKKKKKKSKRATSSSAFPMSLLYFPLSAYECTLAAPPRGKVGRSQPTCDGSCAFERPNWKRDLWKVSVLCGRVISEQMASGRPRLEESDAVSCRSALMQRHTRAHPLRVPATDFTSQLTKGWV